MIKVRNRGGIQIAIAFAISFLLALQSFLLPLAQARAADAAALDAAFSVICSADADHANSSGNEQKSVHCELPCCLPGQRAKLSIDVPVFEPFVVFVPPLLQVGHTRPYAIVADLLPDDLISSNQHRARAPPTIF